MNPFSAVGVKYVSGKAHTSLFQVSKSHLLPRKNMFLSKLGLTLSMEGHIPCLVFDTQYPLSLFRVYQCLVFPWEQSVPPFFVLHSVLPLPQLWARHEISKSGEPISLSREFKSGDECDKDKKKIWN